MPDAKHRVGNLHRDAVATFQMQLRSFASLAVELGVNVQRGQALIVTAPVEAAAFVRELASSAYARGATYVSALYEDPALIRARFDHAQDFTLDKAPDWLFSHLAQALEQGAARLSVYGPRPDLLSGVDPGQIARAHRGIAEAMRTTERFMEHGLTNITAVPFATESWARMVFPGLPPHEAVAALWQAVFDAAKVHSQDPAAAWRDRLRDLGQLRERLQASTFDALRLKDGRTDLTIGLAQGHRWRGGETKAANGVSCVRALPSEILFTAPHRLRAEGRIVLSRPIAIAGNLVQNLVITFADGVVTSLSAKSGVETMTRLLDSDLAARRLGKIGLVTEAATPAPIFFYNALMDTNTATHVALGGVDLLCVNEGAEANRSPLHIDAIFGTPALDVDGIDAAGAARAVMRSGAFVL
jgi:aminopeptidase